MPFIRTTPDGPSNPNNAEENIDFISRFPKDTDEYESLKKIVTNETGILLKIPYLSINTSLQDPVRIANNSNGYYNGTLSLLDKIKPGLSIAESLDRLKSRYIKERYEASKHEYRVKPNHTIDSIDLNNRDVVVSFINSNSNNCSIECQKIKISELTGGEISPSSKSFHITSNTNIEAGVLSVEGFEFHWPLYYNNQHNDRGNRDYSKPKYELSGSKNNIVLFRSEMGCRVGDFPSFGIFNLKSGKWLAATDASENVSIDLGSPLDYEKLSNMKFLGSRFSYNSDNNSISVLKNNTSLTGGLITSRTLYNFDADSGLLQYKNESVPPYTAFAVINKYIFGVRDVTEFKAELCDLYTLNKIVDIYFGKSGKLLAVTPDSFYSGLKSSTKSVAFKIGNRAYPLEQFDLPLNRPDIVLERLGAPKDAIETAKNLRDKRLKRMGVTEDMLKPDFHLPELQIVGDVPASTSKDQLDLQIKATDDKYPLDRLRVYVNNVPVNGRDGELLRDQKTQTLEKTIPIKLAAGRNKIQISVLNSAGAESLYANAEVNCTAERPKPKLYAVALGVSQYDRPEWCLKYAAKDATDLIGKLKAKSGSSYSEVKPLLLTDKEVTKESAAKIKEFLSGATIDDTVLIFMAGHGLLDDKYDYYFGTTDIDPAKPSERGMPYEAIDNILAEVPSLKKALLMDTCHAGELDDDEKKDLASSDGKGTLPAASSTAADSAIKGTVAMRSIGTRGMTVKAIEGAKGKSDWYEKLQDMFVDLRRGSGATVISSSQGAEYAFESSEQSNGLFTYALMEALDGKATPNKDGQITISSIGDYVKKRVQDLTKGKQNPNLRGVNLEEDFVLGTAK